MSHSADDHRSEEFDDLSADGTSTPSNDWRDSRDEPAPDTAAGSGSGGEPASSGGQPYAADPYASDFYAADPHGAGHGGQPYTSQPHTSQPYSPQPHGGQPYGADPYGAQPYGVQPYGQVPGVARKDPAVMLVASLIIPGLGTILNGETGKGVGILAGYVVGALLSIILIGLPIMFGFWAWGMVDAYQGAKAYNARHGLP